MRTRGRPLRVVAQRLHPTSLRSLPMSATGAEADWALTFGREGYFIVERALDKTLTASSFPSRRVRSS